MIMLALILTSTLNMAFIVRSSFAESGESSVLGNDFMEKSSETPLPNKATKPDAKQDKTLESSGQTSRDDGDRWNFNDTSEWSNFAYVDGNKTRLVVGVNGEKPTSLLELEKIVAKHQAEIVNTVSIEGEVKAIVVELLLMSVTAFVEEVRVAGLASYIEPNMKVQAQFVPNDPYWSMQWGPQKIEADWAWNTTVGDPSVLVAVVDTGIDYTHPDLAANYVPLGYDWVNMDADPLDDFGHGTHCAGIIAAVLNNTIGIAGIANVSIMAEKVLDTWGFGYWDWLADGIIHATDSGADIISMSLGGYGDSELMHEAVKYAYDSGVLVIAAAGNENTNMKSYPAGYDEVIAVAATDQYDNKAWWSNWGDWIELAAPGVDIYSTMPTYHVTLNDWGYSMNYDYLDGTSMACPHVSGAAALVWSRYSNKTRNWVRLWLRYTADDLGDLGFDIYYGYGRVNARKAVEETPPAHELIAYEWRTPPYVEPGAIGIINATILNFGESNETDVTVRLLANDTMVDSTLIGFLAGGNSTTASLTWNPMVEGLYNVTFYVVPVPGETSLENNVVWKYIYVGFPVKAVVLHSAGNIISDIITNWQVLNSEWHLFGDTMVYIDYTTLNKEDITYEDIVATEADVLIISCAYDLYSGWEFTDPEIEAIERYVHEGHGLIATAGTLYYWVPNNNKLAPLFGLSETTMWDVTGTDLLHLVNTTHPIFTNVPNPLVFPQVGTVIPFDGRWDSNELVGGEYLALGHYQESAIVIFRGLVYISPWLEVIPPYYHHHLQLLYNAITWSRYQKPEHELVVSLESPSYLQPGESALLNATVSNGGLNNETSVELFLLIDGTIVNSTLMPELQVGHSYIISYLWTPTVDVVYNLTAYAPPLLDEEFTLNNVDSAIIYVHILRFVLWDDVHDGDGDSLTGNYLNLYELLSASGFVIDELTSGTINSGLLANYDILVLIDPELDFSPSEIADIHNWVATGGGLIVIPDGGYPPTINTLMAPYGVQMTGRGGGYGTTTNIVSHPITQRVAEIYVDWVREISVTSPSTCLAWVTEYSERYSFLSATEGGEVAVVSDSNIMDNNGLEMADNAQLMLNMFNWVGVKPEHDLTVTLESPAFLEPATSVLLNATVSNRGLNNETDVELQIWINATKVANVTIPELLTGNSYTLSYLWTGIAEGTYNVTACTPPVPNEEYTRNNVASVNVKVRYVIARVAVLNSWERPPYFTGGWNNNYQLLVDALNVQGFYAQAVINEEIIGGILSFFDVFVIVDNVPNDAAVPWVVDFWSNGGGIVAFDSSICFLCYAGILPPESSGSNGYYVYWDYETSYQARISAEHPVTEGYEVGQIVYGASGDAEYWVDALAGTSAYPYYTMLVEDVTRPNRAYVSAYEPTVTGRVVHIWDYSHWSNTDLQLMILNAMEWTKAPRYEHELAVSLEVPTFLKPGNSSLLNATVWNQGLNNETDAELYLMIDGTVVNNVTLTELPIGESYTIDYLWTPPTEAIYNITAYGPPVPEENLTINNVVSAYVFVTYELGTFVSVNPPKTTVAPGGIFSVYVMITNITDLYGYDIKLYYDTTLLDGLNVTLPPDHFLTPENPSNLFIVKLEVTDDYNATHGRVWVGMTLLSPEPPKSGSGTLVKIRFKAVCPGSSILDLAETKLAKKNGEAITHSALDGLVVIEAGEIWRDVAIVSVEPSATEVYTGWTINITVVTRNEGNTTETFNVTAYYDISIIETKTVTDLDPGENTTLTFNWNTTSIVPGNYTIKAVADTVPGETHTEDNTCIDGNVKVKILGDVNGDGIVDIFDIVIAADAYGSRPGCYNWNPQADLNSDNLIDIFDFVIIAVNFGRHI